MYNKTESRHSLIIGAIYGPYLYNILIFSARLVGVRSVVHPRTIISQAVLYTLNASLACLGSSRQTLVNDCVGRCVVTLELVAFFCE